MMTLYTLIEQQQYAEIELADDTILVIRKTDNKSPDMKWSASWESNHATIEPADGGKPVDGYHAYIYHGKSARLAVENALQARYEP